MLDSPFISLIFCATAVTIQTFYVSSATFGVVFARFHSRTVNYIIQILWLYPEL